MELRPWAGLSRPTRLVPDVALLGVILLVVCLMFIVEHRVPTPDGLGRDLADALAYVEHGATRLNKLVAHVLLALMGALFIVQGARRRLRIQGMAAYWVVALLGWAALSFLWSADPHITVRRGAVLLIMTMAAAGLLLRFSVRDLAKLITFASVIFLLLGIGAEILAGTFAPLDPGYRFRGTLNPNQQGANCALALLGGLWLATSEERSWNRRWLGLAIALFALAFMFLTKSRSGFMSGVAAAGILLLLRAPRQYSALVPVTLVGIVSVFAFVVVTDLGDAPMSMLLLGRDDPERAATLTGRTVLWEALLPYVWERPVHGWGYGAAISPARAAAVGNEVSGWFVLGGPHSAYMSVLLDLGGAGLLLFLGALVSGTVVAIRSYRRDGSEGHRFMASALLFYALNGLLAAHMVYPTVSLWFVLAFGAVASSPHRERGRR